MKVRTENMYTVLSCLQTSELMVPDPVPTAQQPHHDEEEDEGVEGVEELGEEDL